MNQTALIVIIALLAGLSAAGCTWFSFDVLGLLGGRLAARREQKRLEAEARALKEAEAQAAEKE